MFFDIWTKKSELAEQIYSNDNYIVHDNNTDGVLNNKKCVIYCSSNNIWMPNEESAFRYSFVENDYYEWNKTRVHNADREIWIRDIYKSWYVTGINKRICSIDLLIEFLKNMTTGYDVEILGSSAGGYIAVILASALKANKAVVFSAQFNLTHPKIESNPLIRKYKNSEREKYYQLYECLKKMNLTFSIYIRC